MTIEPQVQEQVVFEDGWMNAKEIQKCIKWHWWVTATRVRIPVRHMDTNHIQSCIKCFNGQGKTYIPPTYLGGKEKWLKIFNNELKRRGL